MRHLFATGAAKTNMPARLSAPIHKGAAGADHCDQEKLAIQLKQKPKPEIAHWAPLHAHGINKPSRHKGVTTQVTQGTAIKLAKNPTKDTW